MRCVERRDPVLAVLSQPIWSTSHLNWTNPRACLTQSGPHGAAALFDVSLDLVKTCVVSSSPFPHSSHWMQRFRTGRFGASDTRTYGPVVTRQHRYPRTAPDVRQPSTELLKPTEALQPRLLLATYECGLAVGPLDGPAADLTDGQLGVVIAEQTSSQVIGHEQGVAVAATPTR
jgi:hypothetical protein